MCVTHRVTPTVRRTYTTLGSLRTQGIPLPILPRSPPLLLSLFSVNQWLPSLSGANRNMRLYVLFLILFAIPNFALPAPLKPNDRPPVADVPAAPEKSVAFTKRELGPFSK